MNYCDKILQQWYDGPDHPLKLRMHRIAVRTMRANRAYAKTPHGDFVVDQSDYIGNFLLKDKVYEPATLALCERLLISGGTFFDVGANLGLYTVAMSRNPATKVFAFEPDAVNFLALKRNVELNKRQNVLLFNLALSSAAGLLTLDLPSLNNLGGVSATKTFTPGPKRSIVSSSTIDQVLNFAEANHIDVLKIDVEGHEFQVIQGLSFDRWAPKHIIAEFLLKPDKLGKTDITKSELYNYLYERGYCCKTVFSEPVNASAFLPECNAWFSLG